MGPELDFALNRYRGCMLGVAIGDALGAPLEFMSWPEIQRRFGPAGVSDFHAYRGLAAGCYTDDTQMTIATALGCIDAYRSRLQRGRSDPTCAVYRRYLDWFEAQKDAAQRRGPGTTCLSALGSGQMGTVNHKINDGKGCGGVMRVAPAGLCFPADKAFGFGVMFAAITHSHPSGYLSAGFLGEMIAQIVSGRPLHDAIELAAKRLITWDGHEETLEKVKAAQALAGANQAVSDAIVALGQGWVGEEALAIALFCSLKFSEDFRAGVLASVNHSGDSDSTGAITGAVLGAHLGACAIPERWVQGVEDSQRMQNLAKELLDMFRHGQHLSFDEHPPS